MMDNSTIDLGNGIRLIPPTEEALEYIEQHFREGDAMEHNFFGGSLRCPEGQPSWAVMHGEDIIGVCGFTFASDGGMLSDARVVWFLSTTSVDKQKVLFVKSSRKVLKAITATLPRWVKVIITAPMADYKAAVKWDKRVLGFREWYRTVDNDCEFIVMYQTREEIING